MELQNLFTKYPRPDKLPRVAELAALIATRTIQIEPVDNQDINHAAHQVVYPKAETIAPAHAAYVADLLVKRAESLHMLAEHDCNYGLDDRQEKRRERLQAEVAEIAAAAGFAVETSGDPRGAVVRLIDPKDSRAGDGWGGGWPVYR